MEIGLVSCTKSKRDSPSTPRDLYDMSALLRKARAYCENHHDAWHIPSAKHGLLDPDGQSIEPYDETLTNARVAERRSWAERVAEQMEGVDLLTYDVELVVHAGKAYYEYLLPLVESEVESIWIPTEGLAIGETLAWYGEH